MSCIAILFSIVTAVMLSISIRQGSSALENAVGGFWLVSLVFSVASAITSITILMWWEYASHAGQSISGRALVWLSKGSATLFVTAVVLFSVGLCLFAFSSSQVVAVQAIVIAFTASHYFGLLIVVAWLSRKHQHVKSGIRRFWHSMRRLTQSLIQTSIAPALIDRKDNSVAAPGDRPVIQVTDTEPVSGIATNDVNFSEVDLGSYSHSNLTVPAARRLPGLPGDVQIVRGMRYSPNGMFLCIGNGSPQERCVIFSADSPAIILGELKLSDTAQQIEWSQDGEYILLRLSHTTYIWNAMPSGYARHATIVIHHDADNVKWHPHSDAFLSCKKDILTNFDVQGTASFRLPFALIEDFVFTHDGNHVVCLATVATSVRSGTSTSGARKLIVYDLENKAVAQMVPIGREAHTIVRSIASPEVILVNFAGNTPPQLWQYGQGTPQSEKRASAFGLSFMRAMSFKAPSSDRFYGKGIFGGAEDKLIISVGEEGDMFVFARDSGQLLRHINAPRSSANPKLSAAAQSQPLTHCIAWDPDILSFAICMGFVDGSIWQWKMPFDDLSQNMSTFAVVTLDDRDSIMIRAGDRDVKDSLPGGTQ
ncbi:hypothetical protein DFH11DRAFT_1607505 [Phellopilus nigrolimitatus]|nr:hypothetical protein DFH11DRAFT_1607505 [Phellopilus nigrolimitatus]